MGAFASPQLSLAETALPFSKATFGAIEMSTA